MVSTRSTAPDDLDPESVELEERAAIMQFDGGLSRAEAEARALAALRGAEHRASGSAPTSEVEGSLGSPTSDVGSDVTDPFTTQVTDLFNGEVMPDGEGPRCEDGVPLGQTYHNLRELEGQEGAR